MFPISLESNLFKKYYAEEISHAIYSNGLIIQIPRNDLLIIVIRDTQP